jgi:hypothetical protein
MVGSTILLASVSWAQPPYADSVGREIKALSAEETKGLLEGAGLGFALPAELNGWPGPKHVIELAAMLGIDDQTLARVEAIRAEMSREAKALGAELVAAERELDRLLAQAEPGDADLEPRLAALVDRASALRGRVRFVHLRAHLATRPLLSAEQLAHYERARAHHAHQGSPGH